MDTKAYDIRDIKWSDFYSEKSSEDRIKFLLKYAILAPSTHNSQPWLFKVTNNSCKIYFDNSKRIIEADPIERDLYISFGCLIENLIIAGRYFNVFDRAEYFGKQDNNCVAEIFFKNLEDQKENTLDQFTAWIDAILERVNARGIFEKRSIEKKILDNINQLNTFPGLEIHLITKNEKIREIASLTAEGLKFAYASRAFRKEMAKWMNSSFSKREEGIPGYSLRMPTLISLFFPTLIKFFNLSKWVAILNYRSISSAQLICIISAEENNPITWIKVGQLFERITLHFKINDIKTSVFVASIEMGELYKRIQQILGTARIPHMLFCAGYMTFNQRPNLRHSVENKIME